MQLLLLCSLPVQAKLPIMKNRLAALPTRLLHAPLLKLLLLTLLLLLQNNSSETTILTRRGSEKQLITKEGVEFFDILFCCFYG